MIRNVVKSFTDFDYSLFENMVVGICLLENYLEKCYTLLNFLASFSFVHYFFHTKIFYTV